MKLEKLKYDFLAFPKEVSIKIGYEPNEMVFGMESSDLKSHFPYRINLTRNKIENEGRDFIRKNKDIEIEFEFSRFPDFPLIRFYMFPRQKSVPIKFWK